MEVGLDPIVYLAPVLALAVVLLLGFAGCKFEPGRVTPTLTFRVYVPTTLTVTKVFFEWQSPTVMKASERLDDLTPAFVDADHNVFTYSLDLPVDDNGITVAEAWTVRCQIAVEGGGLPGPEATGTMLVDDSVSVHYAAFQAMGGVRDLVVTFVPGGA